MDIEAINRSFVMLFLLEECNLDCLHCVREDEPMAPGYRLSEDQLRRCLEDLKAMGGVEQVHFSGGEPTLWREREQRLVDLLIRIAAAGFQPSFISNGSRLTDAGSSREFFLRYTRAADVPLRLYLSVDTFHENFDRAAGRSPCLDTVLRCREELPIDRRDLVELPIVIVTISKSPESLLPVGMVEHYESRGVVFRFVPLKPIGRARSLADLCPDLGSDDPAALGAFRGFWPRPEGRVPEREAGSYLILIGEDYHLCDDAGGELEWRRVAALGELHSAIPRSR
jgi:MoaA/NifB/PqqE/SkfB family radical SAM enzyme